jgi:hypothetical protein
MCFETYAEAAAHSRAGNKVVRFRSPEWAALQQQTEAASPLVINSPPESIPPRGDRETLLDFVLRSLSAFGFVQREGFILRPARSCLADEVAASGCCRVSAGARLDSQSC